MEELRKTHRQAFLITIGVGISLALLIVCAEILKMQRGDAVITLSAADEKLRDILLGVALIVFIGIGRIRAMFVKKTCRSLEEAVSKLRIAALITAALSEIPAIMGLILFIHQGVRKDFYVLLGCSLLILVVYFPRYSHWESWLTGRTSMY